MNFNGINRLLRAMLHSIGVDSILKRQNVSKNRQHINFLLKSALIELICD